MPTTRRPYLIAAAVIGLLLVGAVLAWLVAAGTPKVDSGFYPISNDSSSQSSARGLKVGSLAPDFKLADLSTGQPVSMSAMRGKPVWINFWASWCPPCKAELPRMKEEYQKYKGRGLVIVGIDMWEDPAHIREFTKSNSYDWTFVVDPDGSVTNRYFTSGVPTHLFIASSGVIQAIHRGGLKRDAMEELVGKIVGVPSGAR